MIFAARTGFLTLIFAFLGMSAGCEWQAGPEEEVAQKAANKFLYCQATRSKSVSQALCRRTDPAPDSPTGYIDCPVTPPSCDQTSIKSANVCLSKSDCDSNARQMNPQACQGAQLYPTLTSCANMGRAINNCMRNWEADCRNYRLPGANAPAGCQPTFDQTRCETVFSKALATQCRDDCTP